MAGKVWMLFESGAAAEVVLSAHLTPEGNSRPIEAYLTLECDRSFSRAALRGAETAYTWAQGKLFHLSPQIISYDLLGLPNDRGVTGESGGLAFALALATHLYGDNTLPIAATGEIVASPDGGPVTSIKGINAKLKGATEQLPAGGLIFYPKENDFEVSTKARQQALDKGLTLHAVESVEQALDILFPAASLIKPNKALKPWHFIVLLALISIAFSAIFSNDDKSTDAVEEPQQIEQINAPQAVMENEKIAVEPEVVPEIVPATVEEISTAPEMGTIAPEAAPVIKKVDQHGFD